jgi:hypothetical protein
MFTTLTSAQVAPSEKSYATINLIGIGAQVSLVWPTQFTDIAVGSVTEAFTAIRIGVLQNDSTTNRFILPQADVVSPGAEIIFINRSSNSFKVFTNDNLTELFTVPNTTNANVIVVYIQDNTTPNGIWVQTLYPGGGIGVGNINTSSGNSNLTIANTGSSTNPIIHVNVTSDLEALTQFATIGLPFRTNSITPAWSLRSLVGTANQINILNPNGVAGSPTFSLNPTITGIASLTSNEVIFLATNNTNYTSISSGGMVVNVNLTLPLVAPVAGEVLTCTAPNTLGWVAPSFTIYSTGTATFGVTTAVVATTLPVGAKIFVMPNTSGAAQSALLLGDLQVHSISISGFTIETTAANATGLTVSWMSVV